MTQKQEKSRVAMTAIAAVIALSSTQAFAQDATVPDPLVDSTPVETTTTADPVSPEPATPTTVATPAADTTATEATAAPTASKRVAKPAPRRAAAAASTQSLVTPPVNSADASAAAVDSSASATPLPVAPEAAPVPEPTAPVAAPPATDTASLDMNEALPIAGAAGLGLIALAGAGLVMRRRRRVEEQEFEERQWALEHGDAEAEPAFAGEVPVAAAAAPAMANPEPAFRRSQHVEPQAVTSDAPVTAIPEGFDLSRFGRHVQAAYRGPTPDNPSLSLKNRLRRASFFDQQERRAAAEMPSTPEVAPKPASQPAWAARKPNEAEFMFRPARKEANHRPAFQN